MTPLEIAFALSWFVSFSVAVIYAFWDVRQLKANPVIFRGKNLGTRHVTNGDVVGRTVGSLSMGAFPVVNVLVAIVMLCIMIGCSEWWNRKL